MALPHVPYAAQTSPTMSELDDTFGAVGKAAVTPCTATGTNTLVLTSIAGNQAASYENYRLFSFVAVGTSTGPVTAAIDGLGTLNVYAGSGAQADAGDVVSGTLYVLAYNSALNAGSGGLQFTSGAAYSTRPQVQSGASTTTAVSPSALSAFPGVAKAWARISGSSANFTGYGVASVTRQSSGSYTVAWSSAFSRGDSYVVFGTVAGGNVPGTVTVASQAPGSASIITTRNDGTNQQVDFFNAQVVAFGFNGAP